METPRRIREGSGQREEGPVKKADFRQFYRDAHAVDCLSEREKVFLGLAVAMTRNCDP